ncbi:MAG TPA: hypothetical protein VGY98_15395, partial [Verrucomicrobiae bacterium]|nr:hypothetical protein [Verrucomicrobiae bacterium]
MATISFINQIDKTKMKRHRVRLLFGALVIVLLLVYYFIPRPKTIGEKTDKETAGARSSSTTNIATVMNAVKANAQTTQTTASPLANPTLIVNDRQKTNEIRQYMESQNKPIEFYGQIIDQDKNPISGVKVRVEVRHIRVIIAAPWGDEDQIIPIDKETDSGGRFVISGVTGDSLAIKSVEKEGYRLSPKTENIYRYGGELSPYHH